MIELVFKFPDKKPPFFGIQFDNEHEAALLNHSWIDILKDKEWNAMIYVIGFKLELTIYSKREYQYTYKIYKYDRAALKKFIRETRQNDKINFGHVFCTEGIHKIVRTINNNVWVLPIKNIETY